MIIRDGTAKMHLVCVHATFSVSTLPKYAMSGVRLSRAVCGRSGNPPIFNGVRLWNLRGHFQFHGGCNAADAPIRAIIVVSP